MQARFGYSPKVFISTVFGGLRQSLVMEHIHQAGLPLFYRALDLFKDSACQTSDESVKYASAAGDAQRCQR
ncbi:hypothetical protein ACT3UJ_05490, partial [Halomonas sp. 86]|uniref:hypothetical protein n=1 Tax=unclassified Halomonas TaxID=2609666 RepID=UPI0040348725